MNRRTFIILIVTIAVMSAILISNRQDFSGDEEQRVLPGLESELNDITKLTLRTAGNRTAVTLIKGTERWAVAERGNYAADVGKIRKNLIALANATVIEEKTADPTLYARLGVEDIANENATGVEVVIDGPSAHRIIVGKTGVRGNLAYARKSEAAGSLLIEADLDLGAEPADWLDRTIIDMPSSDVSRVTTTHPDGETVEIEKAEKEASGFKLVNQPADTELTYAGAADSIGAALAGLDFDDVAARAGIDLTGTRPVVTRFETFDGLIVTANTYAIDDKGYVGFEFAGEDTATDNVAELDARLGDWLFEIPSYKSDQLTRRMSDLLQ